MRLHVEGACEPALGTVDRRVEQRVRQLVQRPGVPRRQQRLPRTPPHTHTHTHAHANARAPACSRAQTPPPPARGGCDGVIRGGQRKGGGGWAGGWVVVCEWAWGGEPAQESPKNTARGAGPRGSGRPRELPPSGAGGGAFATNGQPNPTTGGVGQGGGGGAGLGGGLFVGSAATVTWPRDAGCLASV